MANEVLDERIGVGPFELRAVLAVILCQDNEGSAKEVFDIWVEDISPTNTLEGDAVCLELESEGLGLDGMAAEPAAGCIDVEHAAEYFCVEVNRTGGEGEGVVYISACAKQGDEVCRGAKGL